MVLDICPTNDDDLACFHWFHVRSGETNRLTRDRHKYTRSWEWWVGGIFFGPKKQRLRSNPIFHTLCYSTSLKRKKEVRLCWNVELSQWTSSNDDNYIHSKQHPTTTAAAPVGERFQFQSQIPLFLNPLLHCSTFFCRKPRTRGFFGTFLVSLFYISFVPSSLQKRALEFWIALVAWTAFDVVVALVVVGQTRMCTMWDIKEYCNKIGSHSSENNCRTGTTERWPKYRASMAWEWDRCESQEFLTRGMECEQTCE